MKNVIKKVNSKTSRPHPLLELLNVGNLLLDSVEWGKQDLRVVKSKVSEQCQELVPINCDEGSEAIPFAAKLRILNWRNISDHQKMEINNLACTFV